MKDSVARGVDDFEYEAVLTRLSKEYANDAESTIDEFFDNLLQGIKLTETQEKIIDQNKMYVAMGFKFGVEWARKNNG